MYGRTGRGNTFVQALAAKAEANVGALTTPHSEDGSGLYI
jgi:hypothetical protein